MAWHPTLIECKYQLGLLLLEECRFEEALPFANYIIEHLRSYKFAYHLKARALVGLKRLDETLNVYDDVIILAPNFSDAHIGRLNVIFKLVQERENERPAWVERFLVVYDFALKTDVKAGDKVDVDVRKLFEVEKRAHNDLHVAALPTSGTVDQNALLQELHDQMATMICFAKKRDTKLDDQVAAMICFAKKRDAKIDELQSGIKTIDGKADTNLDNQLEYSDKMSQMHRQSEALQEMVAAYRAEHVQDDSNEQAILKQIEKKLVSGQDKMLTLFESNSKLLVGITSGIEKSQAILSFLATGDSSPCPKLAVMIREADVPENIRRPRSFVNKVLIKKQCYFFFLCQKTLRAVNVENPMVLKLDGEWLKKLAPFIKASLFAINIASCVTADNSVVAIWLGPG